MNLYSKSKILPVLFFAFSLALVLVDLIFKQYYLSIFAVIVLVLSAYILYKNIISSYRYELDKVGIRAFDYKGKMICKSNWDDLVQLSYNIKRTKDNKFIVYSLVFSDGNTYTYRGRLAKIKKIDKLYNLGLF